MRLKGMETPSGPSRVSDERDGARAVRVCYVPQGFGLALVIDGEAPVSPGDDRGAHHDGVEAETGLLRISDAVVTLEIPRPGGGHHTLSWDPTEVAFDPLVA